jgi:hypothetical protein
MFKTILFELKSLIQNLKRNFLQPTLILARESLPAHQFPFPCSDFFSEIDPSGARPIQPMRPTWPTSGVVSFLRTPEPPPPVRSRRMPSSVALLRSDGDEPKRGPAAFTLPH